MESIHDLFDRVRQHPDFAGGTIFVREDVADALNIELEDVTEDHRWGSINAISRYLFDEQICGWRDAIRDYVKVSA